MKRFRDLDITFEEGLKRSDVAFDVLTIKTYGGKKGWFTHKICEKYCRYQRKYPRVDMSYLIKKTINRGYRVCNGIYYDGPTTKLLIKEMTDLCTQKRRTSLSY